MPVGSFAFLTRRELVRTSVVVALLVGVALWVSFQFLEPAPPRRVVIATGPEFGLYQRHAERYRRVFAEHGVTLETRATAGAGENLALLLDPRSGVDVAFLQGGVAAPADHDALVMLASLYYEPLWVFYRGTDTIIRLNQLRGRRIAVGAAGSGTRALAMPLLTANDVTPGNSTLVEVGGADALRALEAGNVDAAMYVGGAQTPVVQAALRHPALKLVNFERAAAYVRRFPFITKLTLPPGTIDFGQNIPEREVTLIGTEAMLVARDELHPALVNLLVEAAQQTHGEQGVFEAAGEFPSFDRVDIPVSTDAQRHHRYGPSLLYRFMPFWVAALVERLVIVVVPLLFVIVPVVKYLPQFVRWRVRSRAYRYYGELALLEREVASRPGKPPVEQWLRDLDRIERAVATIPMPPSFASEAYTLREHVALVRRAVLARANAPGVTPQPPGGG